MGVTMDQGGHVVGKIDALGAINVGDITSGCLSGIMGKGFAVHRIPADSTCQDIAGTPV